MGSLVSYSGIATKIRAMRGRLLTDADFYELCSLDSVPAAVSWLCAHPDYEPEFHGIDADSLHRGQIEQLLRSSLYRDYGKLYRFAGMEPRSFLKLYFPHYEITLLKKCLRSIFDHKQITIDLTGAYAFFQDYSDLNLPALAQCATLDEFVAALAGSPYQKVLSPLLPNPHQTLFDYEMALDLHHFSGMWRAKNRLFTGDERKILTDSFGARLDLLNLQWIYRAKKYYRLSRQEILSLLVPIHYRISQTLMDGLLNAEDDKQVLNLISGTRYAETFARELHASTDIEEMYRTLLRRIYRSQSRRMPYSIASLSTYLFLKEEELHDIVTAIEGIRYQLPPAETYSYIRSGTAGA